MGPGFLYTVIHSNVTFQCAPYLWWQCSIVQGGEGHALDWVSILLSPYPPPPLLSYLSPTLSSFPFLATDDGLLKQFENSSKNTPSNLVHVTSIVKFISNSVGTIQIFLSTLKYVSKAPKLVLSIFLGPKTYLKVHICVWNFYWSSVE